MEHFEPAYIKTYKKGLLQEKIKAAYTLLSPCNLCPQKCRVDRLSGETGICKTAKHALVSSYNPHFGEEKPLVGTAGSGTIFFTHCNLMCLFCQNFDISHEGHGQKIAAGELAAVMLALQRHGCHNINFVTPSHVVPQILSALEIAIQQGLSVPLVYNSGGYDLPETLKLLDGVFDIYMPDFKFWSRASARRLAKAKDYPERARTAILEMHRQVGPLQFGRDGLARRGLLVRHLVMPGQAEETSAILEWIASEVSMDTYVNIMGQYRPDYRVGSMSRSAKRQYVDIERTPHQSELVTARGSAAAAGLWRLDQRW